MNTLALDPIYGSYGVAFAVSIVLILVIVRFTPPTTNPSHRRSLIVLRLIAGLLLVLAIFRPTLRFSQDQVTPTAVVVAADESLSMTLGNGEGQTRARMQEDVWKQILSELNSLQPSLSVKLMTYGDDTREIENPTSDSLGAISPTAPVTQIVNATMAAFDLARGDTLSGVILLGDGRQTGIEETDSSQATIETLRGFGVPLWTIPMGKDSTGEATRDIAIEAAPESLKLFSGNESLIKFQVVTKGLRGIEIPIQISWINQSGKEEVFATRTVVPTQASDTLSVSIPFTVPQAGSYQLKIEALAIANEIATSNNQQITFVDTREGGGKILYLEGSSSLEQTFLRRSLRRFPDLDLHFTWIPSDTRSQWPVDLNREFQVGVYDIYILGDLHSEALGQEQIKLLADCVASGAGLLTLGGMNAYSAGDYQETTLPEVLPVMFDQTIKTLQSQPTTSQNRTSDQNQINEPLLALPSRAHPIVDLGGSDIDTAWRDLPPLLGANQWVSPKEIPGVATLLESEKKNPLMVIGEYGKGRVASIAFDSSWRWWRAGKSEIHRRFWRQCMLWLLSRENLDDNELMIDLDSRRIMAGSSGDFTITTSTPSKSMAVDRLQATITQNKQAVQPVPLRVEVSEGKPVIKGTLDELSPGIYGLQVSEAGAVDTDQSTTITFQVTDNSEELTRPEADTNFLSQLASATEAYGGRLYQPEEVEQLCEQIKENHIRSQRRVTTAFPLGEDPVSGWILFMLFVMVTTSEWILRRRWGLN